MAFRWRADDGPTLNAGLVALFGETLYFVIFGGGMLGGGGLRIRACKLWRV